MNLIYCRALLLGHLNKIKDCGCFVSYVHMKRCDVGLVFFQPRLSCVHSHSFPSIFTTEMTVKTSAVALSCYWHFYYIFLTFFFNMNVHIVLRLCWIRLHVICGIGGRLRIVSRQNLSHLGSARLGSAWQWSPCTLWVNRPAVIKLLHANPAQHSLYVQVLQGSDA